MYCLNNQVVRIRRRLLMMLGTPVLMVQSNPRFLVSDCIFHIRELALCLIGLPFQLLIATNYRNSQERNLIKKKKRSQLTPTERLINVTASFTIASELICISSTVSLMRSLQTNVNKTPVLEKKVTRQFIQLQKSNNSTMGLG